MTWMNDSGVLTTPNGAFLDDLLGPREMAAFLKMSTQGFYNAVRRGQLPQPIDYGTGPRYSKTIMLHFVYEKAMQQKQAALQSQQNAPEQKEAVNVQRIDG